MARSAKDRLRRLEERRAARRVRYVVVERLEDAPADLTAGPGEEVYVIATGVPRGVEER